MQFEIRALNGEQVDTRVVTATSLTEARRQADELRLRVVSLRPLQAASDAGGSFDLRLFAQELAELLEAGLSVVEAVEALSTREADAAALAEVHASLLAGMRMGRSFSACLETLPQCFPPLFIGLIRAAERTSTLQEALTRYLDYSGRLEALRSQVVSALIYPTILLSVGSMVLAFLMGYVVPRFASVYQGSGRELPAMSALMLDWGALVADHQVALLSALLMLVVLVPSALWLAYRAGKLERALFVMPAVRRKVQLFRLSRLYLTLGTLLNGGMPALQALALAKDVVGAAQAGAIEQVAASLRRGESISRALQAQGLTTPVSARLLRAGESSGRMGEVFIRAGLYHDHELERWIARFSKSFEPILMTVIGVLIGGIVVLLYIPIFDLVGSFG